MTALATRFDDSTRDRLRRGLQHRGLALATRLSELMAGGDAERVLRAFGLTAKPGATPEELLRRALDQVEARRTLLDAGDDRYGRCDVCGVDLGAAALGEMPWADRCQAHAGQ